MLTFYDFLSVISDFVNVFRIEFKEIMTRDRNEKKSRKILNVFELNRFRFCDFSFAFTNAADAVDVAKTTSVADVVKTMSAVDVARTINAVDVAKTVNVNDANDANSATNDVLVVVVVVTFFKKRTVYDN